MHSNWHTTTLGETLPFSYGKNLPAKTRSHTGEFDVVTSAGVVDSHNEAYVHVPSIVIGRKGTIGSLTYCPNPVWPTDTTFFATETDLCNLRFGYYLLHTLHLRELNNDSAVPGLNRSDAHALEIHLPPLSEQVGIAKVLGALDDKIAANDRLTTIALMLQRSYWTKTVGELTKVTLPKVSNPILGGTPKRSDEALWEGNNLWASVADMTKAPQSHLVDTAEKISDVAIQTRRFSPLPAGSVLMSARGTVGRIVSTTKPTSFNQSAYGFVPPEGCGPALRLALLDVVAELKSKSYGSVFSTITKQQINECTVPDVFNPQFDELHTLLNTLESRIIAAELENQVLARTRDELLPLLMSGRITVGEAEEAANVAGTAASES